MGQPSSNDFRDQFEELVAELKRQSNLSYEVQRDRAAAKAALTEEDFEKARTHLTAAAAVTRRTAELAAEEHARSLAALGALSIIEMDFSGARMHYGMAMALPGLPRERLAQYKRSYFIAANALVARSVSLVEGREIVAEIRANDIKPSVVTFNTLVNLALDYQTARGIVEEMRSEGIKPDVITFNTLMKSAPGLPDCTRHRRGDAPGWHRAGYMDLRCAY